MEENTIGITVQLAFDRAPMNVLSRWSGVEAFHEALTARLAEVFDDEGNPVTVLVDEIIPILPDGQEARWESEPAGLNVDVIVVPLDLEPETPREIVLDRIADIGKCLRDMKAVMDQYDGLGEREWGAISHALFCK